ncbi:anthranilate synthase component I family protein [Sphingobacteriaceae bacterium WQ 2009]|uniref:Anthranilate synthase component I family protein n=1 Tax=Rhinopithecimicrobium faecis TaxID=2820698 RepID=A0A8T4H8V4_9SPHI|nr:anthranilate synthase component I family protein [Sphingobacteriaceae bacterium WQ 2009]
MSVAVFEISAYPNFRAQALAWAASFEECCYFDSNAYVDAYSKFESLLAVKAVTSFTATGNNTFAAVQQFITRNKGAFIPGYFSYDLKDEIEALRTPWQSPLDFPLAYFFVPQYLLKFQGTTVHIEGDSCLEIFNAILAFEETAPMADFKGSFQPRISKATYLATFDKFQQHIQQGDIYEVNLCQEFFAKDVSINPLAVFERLNMVSPTPFSSFFKFSNHFILSASPERFLAKRGMQLISQPIKGTAKRGKNAEEDALIKVQLRANPKEIAENIMIVDLVRNDLTLSALPGTVKADPILEVHSFQQVHQLISTISCQLNPAIPVVEAIKSTFPPGSMTGAPKISAMRLCDRYEASARGLYAGAIGYFAENGDFDFNVVIRTLLYHAERQYLSFHTGGAITLNADGEQEYAECLLKAAGILKALDTELLIQN